MYHYFRFIFMPSVFHVHVFVIKVNVIIIDDFSLWNFIINIIPNNGII